MARSLASKPQTVAPDATYEYGNIRDTSGSTLGTPVNTLVYGDFHQFFEKLMDYANVTANGLPDNTTNGYQLFDALLATTRQDLPTLSTTTWASNTVFTTATFVSGASEGGSPIIGINAFRSGGLTSISGVVRINCDTATGSITTPNHMFVDLSIVSSLKPLMTGVSSTIRGTASATKNATADQIHAVVLYDDVDEVIRIIGNQGGANPTVIAGDYYDIFFSITYKSVGL